jgi:lipoyl(octanoyl) transferase
LGSDDERRTDDLSWSGSAGGVLFDGFRSCQGAFALLSFPAENLLALSLSQLSTRCYVDHLERFLASLTSSLAVPVHPLEHTGVFTSPSTKIGSIGIHIRRRISLHGFSLNVEEQTKAWFDQIVACGLADVRSTNATTELRKLGLLGEKEEKRVLDVVPTAVDLFAKQYGRELVQLDEGDDHAEVRRMIEDGVEGRLPPLEQVLLGV